MRYNTYRDTHEAIFDMCQQFCLILDQKPIYVHKFHGNLGILMTKIT